MNKDIAARINDLQILFKAWKIIEFDYDDGEDKATAQRVIDNMIVSTAEEIAELYGEED